MTTFSVIIPTHNRREYLLSCLASVAAQRHRADEVIVVDDGSTDGTLEALADAEGVSVMCQANAGPGAARNRGAAAARCDYLVFLDSDDLWFPWTLEVIAELVAEHAQPALLSLCFQDFSGELIPAHEERSEGLAFPSFVSSAAQPLIVGAGMMVVDRASFLAVGGFSEDRLNAEDHDLTLRLGTARGFVQILRPVTMARRVHDHSETGNLENTLRGIARLIEKERAGAYPGDDRWRDARRTIISRHVRPAVLQAIRAGHIRSAWRLYRDTLLWNARAGHARFVFGSPLLMLGAAAGMLVAARSAPSTR